MSLHLPIAVALGVLVYGFAAAQEARDGERPPRPDNASNAAIGGWCDALTGAKKEQCLRDERKRQEEKAPAGPSTTAADPSTPAAGSNTLGSCEALAGANKERCLRSTFPRAAE